MIKKFKYIFYLFSYSLFILLVIGFYFSDKNINNVNKTRSTSLNNVAELIKTLPLLKNDTNDIIVYKDDVEVFKKKKKKYKFFDLIK